MADIEINAGTTAEVGPERIADIIYPSTVVTSSTEEAFIEGTGYVLTSEGIYEGKMIGNYPKWLVEHTNSEIANNEIIANNPVIVDMAADIAELQGDVTNLGGTITAVEGALQIYVDGVIADNVAQINQTLSTMATETYAKAIAETTVSAAFGGGTAETYFNSKIESYASDNLAYTSDVTQIKAELDSSVANALSIAESKVTANEAYAQAQNAINASFPGGVDAYINSKTEAYANANLAFAADVQTLTATVDNATIEIVEAKQVIAKQFRIYTSGTVELGDYKYVGTPRTWYQYLGGTMGPANDGWVVATTPALLSAAINGGVTITNKLNLSAFPSTPINGDICIITDLWYDGLGSTTTARFQGAKPVTYVWDGVQWLMLTIDEVAGANTVWAGRAQSLLHGPDGSVTGWEYADGNGSSSEFKIRADKFAITSSAANTSVTPFIIDATDPNNPIAQINGRLSIRQLANNSGTLVDVGRFHGSLTTAPTIDVANGDTYYNSTEGVNYIYNGTSWVTTAGLNAEIYELRSNSYVINKGLDGIYTPSTVTFSAYKTVGNNLPSAYNGIFKIYLNNSTTPSYTSASTESSKVYTIQSGTKTIKAELYTGNTLLDTQTVIITENGASAAEVNINSEGLVFSKDSTGVITPSSITLIAAVSNISSPVYQWKKDGVNIGTNSNTYTVSNSDFTTATSCVYSCTVTGIINGSNDSRSDSITLVRLDANNTATVVIDNDNVTIAADYLGVATVGEGDVSTVYAYLGNTPLTYGLTGANTYSVSVTSSDVVVQQNNNVITFESISETVDSGVVNVTIELRDANSVTTTIEKTIKYIKSKGGKPNVALVYTNEALSVPVDNNGIAAWTGSGGSLSVVEGGVKLKYSSTASTVPGTYSVSWLRLIGDMLTEPSTSSVDNDTTVVYNDWAGTLSQPTVYRLIITGVALDSSPISISKDVTITPAFQGITGDPATVYTLLSSTYTVNTNPTGVYDPSTITLSALKMVGNNTPVVYRGRYKIYLNGSTTPIYISSADETIVEYTIPFGTTLIRAELYLAGGTTTKLDETSITVISDGANALTCVLSNETHTIPCDKDGVPITYNSSGTTIYVVEGSSYLSYVTSITGNSQFTVSATGTGIIAGGVTGSISPNRAVVADHTNMTSNPATVTYTITTRNSQGVTTTFSKIQTLTKSVTGATGATGSRGAGWYNAYSTAWSNVIANAACPDGYPVIGDLVTLSSTSYSEARKWDGSAWVAPGLYVDGDVIVEGSIMAKHIATNSITSTHISTTGLDASVIKTGVLYNRDGSEDSYTMKIDLDNGYIHIK